MIVSKCYHCGKEFETDAHWKLYCKKCYRIIQIKKGKKQKKDKEIEDWLSKQFPTYKN